MVEDGLLNKLQTAKTTQQDRNTEKNQLTADPAGPKGPGGPCAPPSPVFPASPGGPGVPGKPYRTNGKLPVYFYS